MKWIALKNTGLFVALALLLMLALFCRPMGLASNEKPKDDNMDLITANYIHHHFEGTCSWENCSIRYNGPLGAPVPAKLMVTNLNTNLCSQWRFNYADPDLLVD